MTSFYSFSVWSEGEVHIPEMHVVLERGQNGFNGLVEDIDAFVNKLSSQGVRFLKPPFQLDLHEPLDRPALLDGLQVDDPAAPEPAILVPGMSANPFFVAAPLSSSSSRGGIPGSGPESEGDGSPSDGPGGTETHSSGGEE